MSRVEPSDNYNSIEIIEIISNKKDSDKVIETIVLDDDEDDPVADKTGKKIDENLENRSGGNFDNVINSKFGCFVDLHNSTDVNEILSCLKCQKFSSDLLLAKRRERRRKRKVPRLINFDSRNSEDFYFKANKKKNENSESDKTDRHKFTCRVCGKIFLFKNSLKIHLYTHISSDSDEGDEVYELDR